MTTIRTNAPDVRVEATHRRATPPPADRRFREALSGSADALLTGVEAASTLVPGGGVVSAAVHGARAAVGGSAGLSGVPDSGLHSSMMEDNMSYLRLQQEMQSENRRFTTLSNVMKARHETSKNSINNIR